MRDEVLLALLELQREVAAIKELLKDGTQQAFTFQEAAKKLGRKSAKTISRMVDRGELETVKVGGREMIPLCEIQRVTTPAQRKARRGGAPKKVELSASEEAAKIRAELRRH